jgi:hypothetical protein
MKHAAQMSLVDLIRAGDEDAVAGFFDVHAPQAMRYSAALLRPEEAQAAVLEGFSHWRTIVAESSSDLDLDETFRSSIRTATAVRVPPPAASGKRALRRLLGTSPASTPCGLMPSLLAARDNGALATADRARLANHLSTCRQCADLAERYALAEHAWSEPPAEPVDDALRTAALGVATAQEYEPEVPHEYQPETAREYEPEAPHPEPEPVQEYEPEPTPEHQPVAEAEEAASAPSPEGPGEQGYAASVASDWVVEERPQSGAPEPASDAGGWLIPDLGAAGAEVPEAVPTDWTLPAPEAATDPVEEDLPQPAAWALAVPAAAAADAGDPDSVATDWVLDGSEVPASSPVLVANGAAAARPKLAPWRRGPAGVGGARGERNLLAAVALLAIVGVAGASVMKGGDDSAKLGSAPIAATPAAKPKPKPHKPAPARPHRKKRAARVSKPAAAPAVQQPVAATPVRQTTPTVRRPTVTPKPTPRPKPKPVVAKPKPKPTPAAPQPDPAGRVPSSDGP